MLEIERFSHLFDRVAGDLERCRFNMMAPSCVKLNLSASEMGEI